jgi:UDP-N-acetylmuramoyl-L-alanyl-D-glutamate--2,6-diaminopimelate ligase
MEVAAQAMSLQRVAGIAFDGAIFTNFDQEHAEFYTNLADYFAAKCTLFSAVKAGAPSLINIDNSSCKKFFDQYSRQYTLTSFGKTTHAQLQITNLHVQPCVTFDLHLQGIHHISCPALVGNFNSYNIAVSVSMAFALGAPMRAITDALHVFPGVPGRFERHTLPNGAMCVIDHAHNPSSFKAVLSTLRQLTSHLIVVFGAGGERDATKRPMMGATTAELADLVVLTSDNPRSECPQAIIEQIKQGIDAEHMHKITEELDRTVAITKAYQSSRPGSVIALLGKGSDEYQIMGDIKTFFSEKLIIKGL